MMRYSLLVTIALLSRSLALTVVVPSAETMIEEADLILVGKASVAADDTVTLQVSKVLKGNSQLVGTAAPLISPYPEMSFPFRSSMTKAGNNPVIVFAENAGDSQPASLVYGAASIWPGGVPQEIKGKTFAECLAFITSHLSPSSRDEPTPIAGAFLKGKLSAETPQGEATPPFPTAVTKLRFTWKLSEDAPAAPIEIRWIAADTGGAAPRDHVIATASSAPGKTKGEFTLSKPSQGFPPGSYCIELRQNEKLVHTETFEIKKD